MADPILENIPTPIIADILARLPPFALIRCSCVCKVWLNLISEPEFVNLHLSKSPSCLILHNLSSSSPNSATFSLVEVEDENHESDHHGVRRIGGMDRDIPRSRENIGMTMIGSIDGLVCINEYGIQHDLIHVWNPIMGEFITVQTPTGERKYPNVVTYGFGISSGKYLVVRIFQEIEITDSATNSQRLRDSTCHVYTIGVGHGVWKSIGHAPYMYSCRKKGLFFNGNLHWLIYDNDSPEKICCLDLEKDLFQPFPPPPEFCKGSLATLNVYKGCLSVCDNTSDFDIVIWVMKEYGVQNSWSKEVVMSKHLINLIGNYYEVVCIVKVFKDGEMLLLWRDDMLFSYNPKTKTVQHIDVEESMTAPCNYNQRYKIRGKMRPCIETTDYFSSIVSLKSLGELNINRS